MVYVYTKRQRVAKRCSKRLKGFVKLWKDIENIKRDYKTFLLTFYLVWFLR